MIIFKIFKWLRRGVFALIAIGVAVTVVSLSGCGEYSPHVPTDETEQEQPGNPGSDDEEPVTPPLGSLNATLQLTSTAWANMYPDGNTGTTYINYTGEIENYHVLYDFDNYDRNIALSIGNPEGNISEAEYPFLPGATYEITIINYGYFPEAWQLTWQFPPEGAGAYESIAEYQEGTVSFTTDKPLRYITVSPLAATYANGQRTGTLDFYISITAVRA